MNIDSTGLGYNSATVSSSSSMLHSSLPEGTASNAVSSDVQLIYCCICGTSIPANPTGKCTFCLTSSVDVTEGIERNLVLPFCRHCNRYQRPPWFTCAWESRELLALCLKRIRGLQGTRDSVLINAAFVYTEPHSRRIKIRLTLQKEVAPGAVVEQDCIVEFVIQPTQCDDCKRAFTPHTWKAVVQVRQKVEHKRSLMYLEQIILKHNAHEKVLKILEAPDGLDVQFPSKSSAQKFAEFVNSHLPTRMKTAKQLVSHDAKSNTAFFKLTYSLEVCPVSKDDLVYLPPRVAGIYGGISSFLLCSRVTAGVQLVDPFTLRGLDIPCDKYWRHPFNAVLTWRHLTEFVVLDIEPVDMRTVRTAATAQRFLYGKRSASSTLKPVEKVTMMSDDDEEGKLDASRSRHRAPDYAEATSLGLADVEIARACDFGVNDLRMQVRTHLGKVLRVGDYCFGYDLSTLNLGGSDDALELNAKIPADVILVRKAKKALTRRRPWVLQRLPIEKATTGNRRPEVDAEDLELFKCDLEEDATMRKEVNLWEDPRFNPTENVTPDDVVVCELLKGLVIDDPAYTFE